MAASSVRITLPTFRRVERAPLLVEVHQAEYQHDLAIYTLASRSPGVNYYRPGTPVQLDWARGRKAASFHGYIDHIEPATKDGDNRVEVWCVGASSLLNDGLQTQYIHRTVPSVISSLARSHQLDVSAEPHGRIFDSITFPGGRIWETMVEYAKQIGYSFYATSARIELHSRTAMVEKFGGQAPVFYRQPYGQGSLYTFAPMLGAEEAGHYRVNRAVTGVDYRTGVPFQAHAGVPVGKLGRDTLIPRNKHYQNVGSSTPTEARWVLQAMTENRRFNITGTAVTDGAPQLRQMQPVLLEGVEEQYRGLWCATKVVHKFNQLDYWLEMELGRDATRTNVAIPDQRARRVAVPRNTPQGRQKVVYPPTVLVNGQWRSQWSSASRTFAGG